MKNKYLFIKKYNLKFLFQINENIYILILINII